LKTFKESAPDGRTVGIVIPHYLLAGGKEPTDPAFLAELGGLLPYALKRAEALEKLPWANQPLPKLYAIVSDLGGFGVAGYGKRYSNKAIVAAECRALRQLGVNGLRAAPKFLLELADRREGMGKDFARARITHAMGFPVPIYRKGRENDPEAGCPFGSSVAERTARGVRSSLEENLSVPVDEVWALTVDEIGTVIDRTPEGKLHLNSCPRCQEAFRAYLKDQGVTPEEFGVSDWQDVRPHWPAKGEPKPPSVQWYWTRKFNNYITAKLFTALKDAFDAANRRKEQALASGETDSPAAKQPWIYSYALRGNTFLMGGHSLDFFDFYRYADNAFVYETSNRGPQIWGWDSYLCDVGRVVSAKMNKRFGIYVKPHRGAPLQRALTAIARNVKMIYWYTYGPDYFKGDSFADRWDAVKLTSKAAHLIGKTEQVLWDSSWAEPARVAIVKPRASEVLGSNAAWENAKWVYTALQHAHIPVDPIDEVMLAEEDLSKYEVIYVNGSYLPRRSAEALARWVWQGGTLWTSGWGCARDEAGKPLKALEPVLGLAERGECEMWYDVQRYRAGKLQSFSDPRFRLADVPEGAKIIGHGPFKSTFMPIVGREVLHPGAETEVFATYADGGVAATRHKYGKGQAYVVGFFPGLEYSAAVRGDRFDMARDFDAGRRSFIAAPALAMVKPVALMNWTYRVSAIRRYEGGKRAGSVVSIVPFKNIEIKIRGAGDVKKVTSAMLGKTLPVRKEGQWISVVLPSLEEGDVLLLE